jgi:hypothetical protein
MALVIRAVQVDSVPAPKDQIHVRHSVESTDEISSPPTWGRICWSECLLGMGYLADGWCPAPRQSLPASIGTWTYRPRDCIVGRYAATDHQRTCGIPNAHIRKSQSSLDRDGLPERMRLVSSHRGRDRKRSRWLLHHWQALGTGLPFEERESKFHCDRGNTGSQSNSWRSSR